MENIIDISRFYETKGDSIHIYSNLETSVKEETIENDAFPEFALPTIKNLTKALALNTEALSIRKNFPEEYGRNSKVCFKREINRAKVIKRRARAQAKEVRRQLEEENKIGMEILREEYEAYENQFRIDKEIDEMFKNYRPEHPEYGVILDVEPLAEGLEND